MGTHEIPDLLPARSRSCGGGCEAQRPERATSRLGFLRWWFRGGCTREEESSLYRLGLVGQGGEVTIGLTGEGGTLGAHGRL